MSPARTTSQAGSASLVDLALYKPIKTSTTVRIDADVVAWLRGGGPGWQTRINAILRQAMLSASDIRQGKPD